MCACIYVYAPYVNDISCRGLQRRDLEAEHSVLMGNMQLEHKQLKNVRDKIEEIQQELDSTRQNIAKWYAHADYVFYCMYLVTPQFI